MITRNSEKVLRKGHNEVESLNKKVNPRSKSHDPKDEKNLKANQEKQAIKPKKTTLKRADEVLTRNRKKTDPNYTSDVIIMSDKISKPKKLKNIRRNTDFVGEKARKSSRSIDSQVVVETAKRSGLRLKNFPAEKEIREEKLTKKVKK